MRIPLSAVSGVLDPEERDFRSLWRQKHCTDGKLLLFTPCDPLFLLIRILQIVEAQNASHLVPSPATQTDFFLVWTQTSASTNTRSLPYQDIFESAGPLMAFPSFATDPDHSRSAKRQRLDSEDDPSSSSDAAASAHLEMLCADLEAFGKLESVKLKMREICHVQGQSVLIFCQRRELEADGEWDA